MEAGYKLPNKWPKLLDMTKDECRKALRALGEEVAHCSLNAENKFSLCVFSHSAAFSKCANN